MGGIRPSCGNGQVADGNVTRKRAAGYIAREFAGAPRGQAKRQQGRSQEERGATTALPARHCCSKLSSEQDNRKKRRHGGERNSTGETGILDPAAREGSARFEFSAQKRPERKLAMIIVDYHARIEKNTRARAANMVVNDRFIESLIGNVDEARKGALARLKWRLES